MTKDQYQALPRIDQLRWLDAQFDRARPMPAGTRVECANRPAAVVGGRPSEFWTARAVRGSAVLAIGHGPTRAAAVADLRSRI